MLATVKVPNLKANHNLIATLIGLLFAVLATVKVPNLKANHNMEEGYSMEYATVKVPNLKANHNLRNKEEVIELLC